MSIRVVGVRTHLDGQRGLSNQVACAGPDNRATNDLVAVLIEKDLGDALIAAE